MQARKQIEKHVNTILLGVSVISIWYGGMVYSGEIETDVDNNAKAISNQTSSTIKLDSVAIQQIAQKNNTVESLQNKILTQGLYGTTLNGMAPADAILTKHFQSYCASESTFESGSNCTADPLLKFGHAKISSILSGTVYSASREQAAQDFLMNLLDSPEAPGVANFSAQVPVDAAKLSADPALKSSYVKALTEEALMSVIRQPFVEMIAKRTALPQNAGGQSEMQIMEQQAIQRFMSTDWVNTMKQMTPEQVQQDQALMQAYQIWLDYQRYRQMERVEALLSILALQNFRSSKNTDAQLSKQPTVQDADGASVQQDTTGTPSQ